MVGTASAIGPIDVALLATPLDYLAAEINRQRAALTLLESLARGLPTATRSRLIPGLRAYFRKDFAQHLADEEQDLLPLLRSRAKPEDQIDRVCTSLREEADEVASLTTRMVEDLDRLAAAREARAVAFQETAAQFARIRRARLAWEVSVLLPLARARLTRHDLRRLGQAMARRRGLPPPALVARRASSGA